MTQYRSRGSGIGNVVRMGRSRLCLVVIIKEKLIAERLSQVDRKGSGALYLKNAYNIGEKVIFLKRASQGNQAETDSHSRTFICPDPRTVHFLFLKLHLAIIRSSTE